MIDRFFLWLGAGVVAAGVTVGMLAGAGAANAHTESDGDGGVKTSQAAKSSENETDSGKNDAGQQQNANDDKSGVDDDPDAKVDRGVVKEDEAKQSSRNSPRSEVGKRTAKLITNFVAAVTPKPARKVVVEKADPVEKVDPAVAADPVDAIETESTITKLGEPEPPKAKPQATPAVVQSLLTFTRAPPTESDIPLETPMLARSEVTATAAPQLQVPPVVSAIGTAVFGLISFAESVFEGPPVALPGSGVTVKRSTLVIAEGHEVPADWYFPEGYDPDSEAAPERIIYLQHGFLARGVFYDYTASYLAKETNSIVVAPTLTSNIFATDGMWLGGDQMHRAVADLFVDTNPELLKSAQAAGYGQDQLPGQVVLIGHSLGGGLVIDTARYMAANPETADKLAGVVMLDGVSFTDPVPILEGIPPDIPVYNLSATPYPWNLFGTMDAALATLPGDQFHGAQLLGGLHSDAMVGGNPLIQFGAYLLTGSSLPSNVEGSQVLAAGWINDMFKATQTCTESSCFYADPGESFTIPTRFGMARGLVQPEPGILASVAREVTAAVFGLFANINFATAPAAGAAAAVPTAVAVGAPNGVTGVQVGHSDLEIECGPDGYTAPADWYFPTQADGSVQATGVIYLQHGFLVNKWFYSELATSLAQQTNSIVVAPSLTSNPLACASCWLNGVPMQQAVAGLFVGERTALNLSAYEAGYRGGLPLPEKFALAGHSAGGGLATAAGGYYVAALKPDEDSDLVGVVMFDGVSSNGTFDGAAQELNARNIPVYQIAAPPQAWNADGATTDDLVASLPGIPSSWVWSWSTARTWTPCWAGTPSSTSSSSW